MERKVIVIAGPTSSGKTTLALKTAELLKTEIISADSRQFYKYLDIGTAKPSASELDLVKHHMISFLEPGEDYNVSMFRNKSLEICSRLWMDDRTPIIAGGSGLYIDALIYGLSDTPDPDPELREQLVKEKNELGIDHLYGRLCELDPESASVMLPQNWKRVIRALEVYYVTGKKMSSIHEAQDHSEKLNAEIYGLNWERELLYERINKRVDWMIEKGLIRETENILQMGYKKSLNSLNTVGYKEIFEYLEGSISLDEAVELIKRNTRRYAKRQLTWFRRNQNIKWLSINSNDDFLIFAGKIASQAK